MRLGERTFKLGGAHGITDPWYEIIYDGYLLDGTKVRINYSNYHRYNLGGIFQKHYNRLQISL